MAIAPAIPTTMKNTPHLSIYVCFGSENLMGYAACMLGPIPEFWHNVTIFERIPLPSKLPYIVIGT